MESISFGDFEKLDLRIATIKEAVRVEGTDKLLRLTVNLGEESRTIVSGIAEFYNPEDLIGKQVPILTNLEPKTFKGLESKGMILAADIDGKPIILSPIENVPPGTQIR